MAKRMLSYLSVVFAIFKRDLLRIVRNPVALVLIIGACALPSAYAWYCTATNWDPYQNTQGIRIAVSNEDMGTSTAETGEINIGEEVVDKLKENHELGWTFYSSSEEAINSVYSGENYAAIIFPHDFSSDFTSILSGDFRAPKIEYYLNEKISAAAPDFTNEGAQVVQDQIDQNFVNTVTNAVFSITQKYGHYAEDKADSAESRLTTGVAQATTALENARSALDETQPALEGTIAASNKADDTLKDLEAALPKLNNALNQARTTLQEARSSSAAYAGQLQGALDQGALDIGKASSEASTTIAKAQSDLHTVHGETTDALLQAQAIVSENKNLIGDLQNLVSEYPQFAPAANTAIDRLITINGDIGTTLESMQKANDALDKTLKSIDKLLTTLNVEAGNSAQNIAAAANTVQNKVVPLINSSLDSYASTLGTLSGLVVALEPSIEQARASLKGLSTSLSQSRNAASDASDSLAAIQGRMETVLVDVRALTSSSAVGKLNDFLKIDASQAASFISAPVKLETNSVYPVKNYGSGVSPFFTSVALWVAGFMFIDLFKMRVRREDLPPFTHNQAYFGRWLLIMFLGILPPIICCAGDLLLGIQCVDPVAFMLAGLVAGLVYVNIMYAFAHAFRYIGKALTVLFLIIQIPGSSGLYPIEMMPGFYQALHPLLPFTYAIDAFREAIGGFYGANYAIDLLVLVLVFVPASLFVGLVLGKWASNLTLMLDREIGRTGLFDGEKVPKDLTPRLSTLLKAVLHTPEYRQRLLARMKEFDHRFPLLRKIGWVALAAQFIATFAVMILLEADVNTKLILLLIMVAGIVVVDTYLIVVAYMKLNFTSQAKLADLTGTELTQKAQQLFAQRTLPEDDQGKGVAQ